MLIPTASLFRSRMSELIQRLGSIAELMRKTGLSRTSVDNYLSGKSEPSLTKLREIAAATDADFSWLLGIDTPARDQSTKLAIARKALEDVVGAEPPDPMNEPAGFVLVPRYDVQASAGAGALAAQEDIVDYMAFRDDWVRRRLRVNPANLALIEADGDSMNPTIQTGDLLLVDRGVRQFVDDAIYVILLGEFLSVKRLQRKFDGALDVKSDNPAYDTQVVAQGAANLLNIAGRVIWFGRKM
ncbi:MAG: XRE family transcriptional regulator, partial [Alphaproteobacteria bacterium]